MLQVSIIKMSKICFLEYIKSNYPDCQRVYIGLQKSGNTWSWINGDNSNYLNWGTSMNFNLVTNLYMFRLSYK